MSAEQPTPTKPAWRADQRSPERDERSLGLAGSAEIRALLRRSNQQRNPILQCGSLSYDSNSLIFSIDGVALTLTRREHAVLETLIMKTGKTVSKQALAESLYAMAEDVSQDAIEVYIHRIRKKLEHGDAAIITLRGLGYLLKQHHEI